MPSMRLTDKADLDLMYDIEVVNYPLELIAKSGFTKEHFRALYAQSSTIGFEIDGRQVGGIIYDGQSAHIAVLPAYHGRWARLWKPALNWLFSLQDPIYSKVQRTNEKCLYFMERNNWRRVKEDATMITFEITAKAKPHGKIKSKGDISQFPKETPSALQEKV